MYFISTPQLNIQNPNITQKKSEFYTKMKKETTNESSEFIAYN